MRKVDFFIAGTQKGGTTSAQVHLNEHPNIMVNTQEIHFFDDGTDSKNYDEYHSRFNFKFGDIDKNILIGEKTPSYSYNIKSIKRIQEYNEDAKILVFLREPISRIYSQWQMYKRIGLFNGDFKEFINLDKDVSLDKIIKNGTYPIQRSLYIEHLQSILKFFKKDNLHVSISEVVKSNPLDEYNSIFNFFNLEKLDKINFDGGVGEGNYDTKPNDEDRLYLYNIVKDYNQRLYDFLGYEIKEWEEQYKF